MPKKERFHETFVSMDMFWGLFSCQTPLVNKLGNTSNHTHSHRATNLMV